MKKTIGLFIVVICLITLLGVLFGLMADRHRAIFSGDPERRGIVGAYA